MAMHNIVQPRHSQWPKDDCLLLTMQVQHSMTITRASLSQRHLEGGPHTHRLSWTPCWAKANTPGGT